MAAVDKLRNNLINKILTIKNKEFLLVLDQLVSSKTATDEIYKLTSEQKELLMMSETDIEQDQMISQEAMDKRNLQWLNDL